MKIGFTNQIDRNSITTGNASKVLFAESIIEFFTPLFCEELDKKQGQLNQNKSDTEKLKETIKLLRDKIQKYLLKEKEEKVKSEVLDEIQYLASIDVIYGSNREQIKKILLALDDQTVEQLEKNLLVLRRIVKNKQKER